MKDAREENFHKIERRYGSFVRGFSLPATIDTETTEANFENGVLSVTLRKKEAAKPKAGKDSDRLRQQLESWSEAGGSVSRGLKQVA